MQEVYCYFTLLLYRQELQIYWWYYLYETELIKINFLPAYPFIKWWSSKYHVNIGSVDPIVGLDLLFGALPTCTEMIKKVLNRVTILDPQMNPPTSHKVPKWTARETFMLKTVHTGTITAYKYMMYVMFIKWMNNKKERTTYSSK